MNDLIAQLADRQTPIARKDAAGDEHLHFAAPGLAHVDKDSGLATYSDPDGGFIESDPGKMTAKFRISTPRKDRTGDVLAPKGCLPHIKNYTTNPVVFFNHRSYCDCPIATSADSDGKLLLEVTDTYVDAVGVFHGKTADSTQVFALINDKVLKAASVGFRPVKGKFLENPNRPESERDDRQLDFRMNGFYFEEWDLLEWSVVGIPCNPDAVRSILSKGMIAGEKIAPKVSDFLKKFEPEKKTVVRTGGEVGGDVPGFDVRVKIAEAEAKNAELEASLAEVRRDFEELKKLLPAPVPKWAPLAKAKLANECVIELPDFPQPDDYSCGACATMSVAKYFGVGPDDVAAWKELLGTTVEKSTHPAKIVEVLRSLGLSAEPKDHMTLGDLQEHTDAGRPVIVCVQDYMGRMDPAAEFDYGHYLAVIGVSPQYVFAQDPSEDNIIRGQDSIQAPGKVQIAREKFLEVWHDKDADGVEFCQFGIVVCKPEPVKAAAPVEKTFNEPPAGPPLEVAMGPETHEKPKPEEKPKSMPHGAKALGRHLKNVYCAIDHLDEHGELVEHPKVGPAMKEFRDEMAAHHAKALKLARKHYPDFFPEEDSQKPDKAAPAPVTKTEETSQGVAATAETATPDPAWAKLAEVLARMEAQNEAVAKSWYKATGQKV